MSVQAIYVQHNRHDLCLRVQTHIFAHDKGLQMKIRPILPANSGLGHQEELVKAWDLHDQVNANREPQTSPPNLPPQPAQALAPQKAISNRRRGTEAYLVYFGARELSRYRKAMHGTSERKARAFKRVALGVPVLDMAHQANDKNNEPVLEASGLHADARTAAVLLSTALPGGRKQASQQRASALLKLQKRPRRRA